MALEVFDPTNETNQKERIIVYGRAGIGKTRFVLSLTPRFGDILYYAADESSEFLQSLSSVKRARIHVLKPRGDDPIRNFQQFCIQDWRKDFPTVGTLVVDTYTKIAQDAIAYSANTGAVTAEKHFKVGDPTAGGQVIPNRGDYMGVESISRGFLDRLLRDQAHYNIILVCHEDIKIVEGAGVSLGGPSHPGRKMTEDLPAMFSTVIRLIREPILTPGATTPENKVIAVTSHTGQYIAKLRENDEASGNPIPRVVLDTNPVNFWIKYDALFAPTTPTEVTHV
jgi:hypothetical protein